MTPRERTIDAADLSFLMARRALRSRGDRQLRLHARRHLAEAYRYYTEAGLSRRADVVARYAYRLLRFKTPDDVTTLQDAILEHLYGPRRQGGDA
jgi:hypothetical protein